MENIREINTGKANIALVKIESFWVPKIVGNKILFNHIESPVGTYLPSPITLSEGKWKVLNLLPDLTEEQCSGLLTDDFLQWHKEYVKNAGWFEKQTAKHAFNSLLEANAVYSVNPYGKKEPKDVPDLGTYTRLIRQKHQSWKKAQENVGTWLVLVREQDL